MPERHVGGKLSSACSQYETTLISNTASVVAELVVKRCLLFAGHALLPSHSHGCQQGDAWVFLICRRGEIKKKNHKPLSKGLSLRTQWDRGELCTNDFKF